MLFRRKKHISSVCPKTGKHPGRRRKYGWLIWLFPITGLLSLIWFLIRVVPKPSRATYPCQRVAAPLACSFVAWITGIIGSTLAYRKAQRLLHQSRYALAGICAAVAVMAIWWSISITSDSPAEAAFNPTDPPNSPMGVAKGIHPGRVVWVHDPDSTSWDGSTGDWWDDNNTDQDVVDFMTSKVIQTLTGESSDPNAWDALFRHFNQTRGFGDVGYQQGEKITIKLNMNQNRSLAWGKGQGMPSPHAVYSLLDQLINTAGVPGSAITLCDASRYIGDPIYDKVRSNPDPNFQSVRFVADRTYNGRIAATRDLNNPIHFGNPYISDNGNVNIPRCYTQAKYFINMALFRSHSLAGVTLCAKNHFGSTYFPSRSDWTPSPLHNYMGRNIGMNTYNCLVDLIGHQHLGGKTLLYMIDGLYSGRNQENNVTRFQFFDNDWCSSIFASQDPVAIDSVALDFLRNETGSGGSDVTGNPDNYMHEAALANDPCSGTVYDPEGDGTPLESLGVHEHWNNPTDKQYSRNLGTGDGIELALPSLTSVDGPIKNVTAGKRYDYIRLAIRDANSGDEIVVGQGIYPENIDFRGRCLTVRSTDPNDPAVVAATVINGSNANPVVTFSNNEDASCVLAGFTITGGKGGILCSGASPTITNCIISGNSAENLGGGICCEDNSKPIISNCIISSNSALWGGGIYYEEPAIPPPPPTFAFALSSTNGSATITDCDIIGNTAELGGGMYNESGSPMLSNCIFSDNSASQAGGGMYNRWSCSNPTIINCTFSGNIAGYGSGICCTDALLAGLTIKNCILWNGGDEIWNDGFAIGVTYSDVQGGWPGEGNIDADPCFADPNNGDYHLKSKAGRWNPNGQIWVEDNVTSRCIDAGDPASDWTSELWPHGKCINMGAYGGTIEASMSLLSLGNIADLDNDGFVNYMDTMLFTDKWLYQQVLLPENLDRKGIVDFNDFAVFAGNWLWEE